MRHACGQFRLWNALLWSICIFINFSMASGKTPKILNINHELHVGVKKTVQECKNMIF